MERKKEFIFTIARMNPPTTGHKDLIKQMAQRALATRVDKVHIILSSSNDEKNPLLCGKKRKIINEMTRDIRGVNIIIVCMDDPTDVERCGSHPILKSICHAISHATGDDLYTNATLFIGDDRASSYGWIGVALAKNNPPIELELVPLDRKVNPISATKIRAFIKDDDYSGFMAAYEGSGLSQETLNEMYSSIQSQTFTKKRKLAGGRKVKRNKTTKKRKKKKNSSNKRNKSFR